MNVGREPSEGGTIAGSAARLVAVLDGDLRIVFGHAELGRLLEREPLAAFTALPELLPKPDVARDLGLLVAGVASEVRVAMLDDDRCLLARRADAATLLLFDAPTSRRASYPAEGKEIFVGRGPQLEAFDRFLAAGDDSLLVVEGPLGVGKTSLLDAFHARCRRLGTPVFRLDARTTRFHGDVLSFLASLRGGDGADPYRQIFGLAGELAGRTWVLLVDNFDVGLSGAEEARAAFFRSIPDGCRVVLAMRTHAKPLESIFPRHRPKMLPLGALSRSDAEELAMRLGIDEDEREAVLRRAEGHPLSLRAYGPSANEVDPFDAIAYEGVLPVPKAILKLAALPRRITEDLLAILLEDEDLAADTYDALAGICMPDVDNFGLRMPDFLRRALSARFQRRSPVRHLAVRVTMMRHFLSRLEEADPRHAPFLVDDLFDSFHAHEGLARAFGVSDPSVSVRRLPVDAAERARSFLRTCNFADTAAFVARLRSGTPTFVAERAIPGAPPQTLGMMQFAVLSSHETPLAEDRRRVTLRSLFARFAGSGEVRIGALLALVLPDEEAALWGDGARALAAEHLRLLLTTRGLAASVTVLESLGPKMDVPGEEIVELEALRLRLRDLRKTSIVRRLRSALDADGAAWFSSEPPEPAITTETVRHALANLDRPSVVDLIPARGSADMHVALRESLELVDDPRQREILRAVYVEKRGKHELIAVEMGMPYSTFRRHHTRGLERVRELLIERMNSASLPGMES